MKKIAYLIIVNLFVFSCKTKIKEEVEIRIEKGTEIEASKEQQKTVEITKETEKDKKILGFWVGYFEPDVRGKEISVDEGFYWNRNNKINISIDKITDSIVTGHSVVAGNNRPFTGFLKQGEFKVAEPGDDKYDGEFIFKIINNELVGKWQAYKNINIKKRKYTLKKKTFSYDKNRTLEESRIYVDWNKFIEEKTIEDFGDGDFEEWIRREFARSTNRIYKVNASNTKLTKSDVENLKKGDLKIIRNTIYARHGYSFKNRPLRVFFDAQSWYIPVHNDIKADFTDLEKENIKLLLRYEKNAEEYYDYFGRG